MSESTGAPEALFRLWWDGGVQRPGEPLDPGAGQAMLLGTPMQWYYALEVLSAEAFQALMLVIEHGYRPGQPTVVVGFGRPWLIAHGMEKGPAERAARELTTKGYLRRESMPGTRGPIGTKMAVVPGGLLQDIPDAPGDPAYLRTGRARQVADRRWGTPADTVDAADAGVVHSPAAASAAALGTGAAAPTGAVDNPSARVFGTGAAGVRGAVDKPSAGELGTGALDGQEAVDNASAVQPGTGHSSTTPVENVQVSAAAGVSGTRASTGATRRLKTDEEKVFFVATGEAVTQARLDEFLVQPALRTCLAENWEVAVAALSRQFVEVPERCARVLTFLGEEGDEVWDHPANTLAAFIVDVLGAPEGGDTFEQMRARLRRAGVSVSPHASRRRLLAGVVAAAVTSLHKDVDTFPGWFGAVFRADKTWFPTPALMACLTTVNDLLDGQEALGRAGGHSVDPEAQRVVDLRPWTSATPEALGVASMTGSGASYGAEAAAPAGGRGSAYIDHLRRAASETGWNTEEGLAQLLRNPSLARTVLDQFAARQSLAAEAVGGGAQSLTQATSAVSAVSTFGERPAGFSRSQAPGPKAEKRVNATPVLAGRIDDPIDSGFDNGTHAANSEGLREAFHQDAAQDELF